MYRTWLFLSGSNDKHLKKVKELSADAFILDLEDAVSIANKQIARLKVKEFLQQIEDKTVFVRVNGLSTPYFLDDLNEIVRPHLAGIFIPKTNCKEDITIADYILEQLEIKHGLPRQSISIVPMIETAEGMNNVQEIAVASKRIYCLAFGAEDLMLDLKIEASDDEQELLFFRSQLVLASKVAGLEAPIDSVYINFKDSRGLKRASENGNKLGFQGKLLIHPNQIEIVNQAFAPTPEQILKAREIVEKYDAVGEMEREVIQVDGKMIDNPVVERARKILEQAELSPNFK